MKLLDTITINGVALETVTLQSPPFFEQSRIDVCYAGERRLTTAQLTINGVDLGAPTRSLSDPHWHWIWSPRQAVGRFEADIRLQFDDGSAAQEHFTLQIAPAKLDQAQYEALALAMQHEVRALVYALSGGRAGVTLAPDTDRYASLVEEYYALTKRHVGAALELVKRIEGHAQQQLRPSDATVGLGEVQWTDRALLADLLREPWDEIDSANAPGIGALRDLAHDRRPRLPRTVRVRATRPDSDTVEHRLLKYVLQVLLQRLRYVGVMARREQRWRTELDGFAGGAASANSLAEIQTTCAGMTRRLRAALARPLLDGVSPLRNVREPTHLMRRDPRYRALYGLYRALRTAPFLAFDSPSLWVPLHELPLLYEQWCALRLIRAVAGLGTIVEQRLVAEPREREGVWTVTLQRDAPSLVMRLPDDRLARVRYQRRFGPKPDRDDRLAALDAYVRIPDLVVEIATSGEETQLLVFDAKYRVAPDGRPPQDALDDMYAYRGAIGRDGARATLAAYVLYPGTAALHTADNVGAIPLLPNATNELSALLKRWLGGVGT